MLFKMLEGVSELAGICVTPNQQRGTVL